MSKAAAWQSTRTVNTEQKYVESWASLSQEIDLSEFYLDGRKLDAQIDLALVDGTLESTIEAASTLTLNLIDDESKLIKSGIFNKPVRLSGVARQQWQFVQASKQGQSLSLTFEDLRVARLRTKKRPRRFARGKVTRAQAARALTLEVKHPEIEFVCPELNKRQPIGTKISDTDRAANRGKGLSPAERLTIKGVRADKTQLKILERSLDQADTLNAGSKATLALIVAIIQESVARNLKGGDRDSRGVLQVRDSTARSMRIDNRDVEACVTAFLQDGFFGQGGAIQVAKSHPSYTVGQIAQAVQGSAHPSAYDLHRAEAKKIVAAYGGVSSSTKSIKTTGKYEFSRGKPDGPKGEDSWACLGRLADKVGWRRFVVGTKLYFMSEADLMASKPRVKISEGLNGVDVIDFNVDSGRPVDEATVTCVASSWTTPPGSTVLVVDMGPADGRWLVSSISRGLFDFKSTIQLRRGKSLLQEKSEPVASDTASSTSSSSDGGKGGSSSTSMLRPVSGGRITSGFGRRVSPTKGASSYHDGIDIGVPVGTTVKAVLDGTVAVSTSSNGGYGGYVELRHANGLKTFYGHLSREMVKKGQRVSRGDTIAKSGNTGTSTGAHLHFGVHKNGKAVDPENYL